MARGVTTRWKEIRAEYERGVSPTRLAEKYAMLATSITSRAGHEHWERFSVANSTGEDVNWFEIRKDYEANMLSFSELADKHKVSVPMLRIRCARECWVQDIEPLVRSKIVEKLAGINLSSADAQAITEAKEQAAAIEAGRRADVLTRHRSEWEEHKPLLDAAIGTKDFDAAKLAKITAEVLLIRQSGERRAWGFDAQVNAPTTQTMNQTNNITIAELREAREKIIHDV